MSPSKTRLPAKRRRELAAGLATIIGAVDFPDFVAALLDGTFQAIVDGSVRQVKAYADLVRDVASSIEGFERGNVRAKAARDRLIEKYGPLLDSDSPPTLGRARAQKERRRRLSPDRRQLVATLLLMGINRIVVTDGKINAKVTLD